VPLQSYLLQQSELPSDLISELSSFVQGVILEKLVTQAKEMCISGPRLNAPRAEVLLNTKIAIQYSKDHKDCMSLEPMQRPCAHCRKTVEEVSPAVFNCCPMGSTGCLKCVGRQYVCPTCEVVYVRRWAYETGSGRGTIGRNREQFSVKPFTNAMHVMAEKWGTTQDYNNMALVVYCGADMCAHCACGLEHKSIKCGTILGMHQDNAQSSKMNSQVEASVNRTLNLGATRTLTMTLVKHLGAGFESSVPNEDLNFRLHHGSEFILNTLDEVEMVRQTDGAGATTCSWKHGMVTPIQDAGISAGIVGRCVRQVRDVRADNDIIIDPDIVKWRASNRGAQFSEAQQEWHQMSSRYQTTIEPRVQAALRQWQAPRRRETRQQHSLEPAVLPSMPSWTAVPSAVPTTMDSSISTVPQPSTTPPSVSSTSGLSSAAGMSSTIMPLHRQNAIHLLYSGNDTQYDPRTIDALRQQITTLRTQLSHAQGNTAVEGTAAYASWCANKCPTAYAEWYAEWCANKRNAIQDMERILETEQRKASTTPPLAVSSTGGVSSTAGVEDAAEPEVAVRQSLVAAGKSVQPVEVAEVAVRQSPAAAVEDVQAVEDAAVVQDTPVVAVRQSVTVAGKSAQPVEAVDSAQSVEDAAVMAARQSPAAAAEDAQAVEGVQEDMNVERISIQLVPSEVPSTARMSSITTPSTTIKSFLIKMGLPIRHPTATYDPFVAWQADRHKVAAPLNTATTPSNPSNPVPSITTTAAAAASSTASSTTSFISPLSEDEDDGEAEAEDDGEGGGGEDDGVNLLPGNFTPHNILLSDVVGCSEFQRMLDNRCKGDLPESWSNEAFLQWLRCPRPERESLKVASALGFAFEAFMKVKVDDIFGKDVFRRDHSYAHKDLKAGAKSPTNRGGEIKNCLTESIIVRPNGHKTLSRGLFYNYTGEPKTDALTDIGEADLARRGMLHQILMTYDPSQDHNSIKWPIFVTNTLTQLRNYGSKISGAVGEKGTFAIKSKVTLKDAAHADHYHSTMPTSDAGQLATTFMLEGNYASVLGYITTGNQDATVPAYINPCICQKCHRIFKNHMAVGKHRTWCILKGTK